MRQTIIPILLSFLSVANTLTYANNLSGFVTALWFCTVFKCVISQVALKGLEPN